MGVTDSVGSLLKLVKNVNDAALKISFQEVILELQGQLGQLQEENLDLKAKVREQEERLKAKEDMVALRKSLFFAQNAYWKRGERGLIAYCPGCLNKESRLVPLIFTGSGNAECPACRIPIRQALGHRPEEPEQQ